MKKVMCVLLVLLVVTSVTAVYAFADGQPTIVVSSVEDVQVGEEVTVTVSLKNNPGIANFMLLVDYDQTMLEWTAVTKGSLSEGNWDVGVGEAIWWINSDNYGDDGVIFTLTFKVLEGAQGTTPVTVYYDDGEIFDDQGNDVDFAIVSGGVTLAHDHQYIETMEEEATCVTEGRKTLTCTICGDTKTETIAKLPHETALENAAEATCTMEGYTGDQVCQNCGQVIGSGEWIAKTDHTWGDYKELEAATCTAVGVMSRMCVACGQTDMAEIPMLDHTPGEAVTTNEIAASCTVAGSYDTVVTCEDCGGEISRVTTEIPAKGHSFGQWQTVISPNCTDKGSEKRVCADCGYEESRDLEATGHEWDETYTVDQAATCTQDGSRSLHCANCDAVTDSQVIPASGHAWDEGKVTKEATCDQEGVKTYVCANCGGTKTEVLEKLTHDTALKNAVEATCAQSGYTGDQVCQLCGQTVLLGESVDRLDHTWDEGKVTKEATEAQSGEKVYTCAVCGETKTEVIPVLAPAATPEQEGTDAAKPTESPEETTAPEATPEAAPAPETTAPNTPAAAAPDSTTQTKSTAPKTGDDTPLAAWIALLSVSALGLAVVGKKRKG